MVRDENDRFSLILKDLLKKILTLHADKRLTIPEILAHPFLTYSAKTTNP